MVNNQEAILHKNIIDKEILAQINIDCILICEVSPTLHGWRVTKVLECNPPQTLKCRGTISFYKEENNYAFATIFGESRNVFCPFYVLKRDGLISPTIGLDVDIEYIESHRGLLAKKIKAIL
jgi:cold shock CspA family protein